MTETLDAHRLAELEAAQTAELHRRALLLAAERAKLPTGWVTHDLRHRRVTTWLAEGMSPVLVKEAMGHTDLSTTMDYMHLAREHLRALVEPSPASQSRGTMSGGPPAPSPWANRGHTECEIPANGRKRTQLDAVDV
jgi:hypothetical protein